MSEPSKSTSRPSISASSDPIPAESKERMEGKSRATVCELLLALLVLTHEGGVGNGGGMVAAEARVCTGKSRDHSFPCISDRLCTNQCLNEQGGGWTAGYCHFRYCRCQKAC